ncbi:MAG: DNA polymerase III subunit delta [Bacilli bacterium]|nr:DNA polymerase III subunit delta [Bacilli bacterium]
MVYLFYGTEEFLLQKEIDTLIQKQQIGEYGVTKYNLETTKLEDILEDISMPSLFENHKAVICENAYIFTGQNKRGAIEQNITLLEEYLKHQDKDNFLVFKVLTEKLDERKKIVKQIKKVATVKECKREGNLIPFVQNLFKDYQIEYSLIPYFIKRIGEDLYLLEQEATKVKLYKYDEKVIKKEDIDALTSKTIDLNIFNFIDHIITKQKKEAMETYDELIKRNEEPLAIIVMLANQFRIMYQSKELLKKGYTEKSIAETLNIHPYRVKKALEKTGTYTSETLLNYLQKLGDLDKQIKTGQTDKYLALELFILGM